MGINPCRLCPRQCGVPRGEGYCGAADGLEVASVCVHRGEEPPLNPIVNIFFAHCNLQCIYCQNRQISGHRPLNTQHSTLNTQHLTLNTKHLTLNTKHWPVETAASLADRIIAQLPQLNTKHSTLNTQHLTLNTKHSTLNTTPLVGFVTAAHYIDQLPAIVDELRRRGVSPTVVYNSGGYESVEALRTLEGLVDIYLPDLKYMDPSLAALYSHAPDYPEVAAAAIVEMRRQVGASLKVDADGTAYRGLLVRHLVLPGCVDNSLRCVDWLADHLSPVSHLSLMAQYFPPAADLPAPLDRTLAADEYAAVVDHAAALGFTNIWTQELDAQCNYRPDFTHGDHPFE